MDTAKVDRAFPDICEEVEQKTGKIISQRKRTFALHYVTSLGNQAEAARKAGYSHKRARQQGYEMAKDPEIQALIEELSKLCVDDITEETIKQGILKEALTADASRDRHNAWVSLGKNKSMFKDVLESTSDNRTREQTLDDIEKNFGTEARRRAERELGFEVDEEQIE